jgi:hypothetical protein
MPSQILHTLFGEDVIAGLYPLLENDNGLGPVACKALEKNSQHRSAFVLGCQGPDIFYHNLRTRPAALEYGSLLHRRGYGNFCARFFGRLLQMSLPNPLPGEKEIRGDCEKGVDVTGVYALGFMTHAALDRFCHPYIVYKSVDLQAKKNAWENGLMHPFFERILDVLMLRELRHRELSSWEQETLAALCETPPPELKKLIVQTLTDVFPEKAGRDGNLNLRIDNTFTDCARFYRMSDPAKTATDIHKPSSQRPPLSRRAVSLAFPENLPSDIDFLNEKKEPWFYPYRPLNNDDVPAPEYQDTRSFPEIYTDAVKTTVASLQPCFAEYLNSGIFPADAFAQSIGNGCLSIRNEEGKPCAPNFTNPLPLGEVLDLVR